MKKNMVELTKWKCSYISDRLGPSYYGHVSGPELRYNLTDISLDWYGGGDAVAAVDCGSHVHTWLSTRHYNPQPG